MPRKYERGFSPDNDGFVADLNCSKGVPPTCPGVAPPPPMRVRLTMGKQCWAKATAPGAPCTLPWPKKELMS